SVEIDKIIDDHRARFGSGQNSSRGVLALGLLNAQWAELSYFGQATGTRVKTIALRRANRVLALTCSGDDPAQAACEAGIKPEHGFDELVVTRDSPFGAAALRTAQVAIRKHPRTASPYYWAGFPSAEANWANPAW